LERFKKVWGIKKLLKWVAFYLNNKI